MVKLYLCMAFSIKIYGLLSTTSLENIRYIHSEFGYFGFILLIFNDLEYNKCQI